MISIQFDEINEISLTVLNFVPALRCDRCLSKSFATPAKSAVEIPYTTGKQVSLLGRNGVFSGSALQPISLTFATPMRVKPKLNEKFQTPVKNLNKV